LRNVQLGEPLEELRVVLVLGDEEDLLLRLVLLAIDDADDVVVGGVDLAAAVADLLRRKTSRSTTAFQSFWKAALSMACSSVTLRPWRSKVQVARGRPSRVEMVP
jgi:hypothetical protein